MSLGMAIALDGETWKLYALMSARKWPIVVGESMCLKQNQASAQNEHIADTYSWHCTHAFVTDLNPEPTTR